MNSDHVQGIRYKLQKRVRRLMSADFRFYHGVLCQVWGFLIDHEVLRGILEALPSRLPSAEADARKVFDGGAKYPEEGTGLIFDDELEGQVAAYFIVKWCAESSDHEIERKIGRSYGRGQSTQEWLEPFNELFVEPLYEYVDEQLDEQGATLGLLLRYKHKCEWFQRGRLFNDWEANLRAGERLLATHLYEYLYDQGLDFHIEPWSVSGEADLVAGQTGDNPLVADAKVFTGKPGHERHYIARGFAQIYQYTLDHNVPVGYLVIHNTSGKDLKLAVGGVTQMVPFVVHNGKTVYLLVIDIFPHDKPASKRGPLEAVAIDEEYLIRIAKKKASGVTGGSPVQ